MMDNTKEPSDATSLGGDVDRALLSVGRYSRRRICAGLMVSLTHWPLLVYGSLAFVFTGETLPHNCKVPPAVNISTYIPKEVHSGEEVYSQCKKFATNSTNVTVPCGPEGWEYDNPGGEHTIVSQWDLVCERDYLSELAQTIYFAGTMLGYLVAGPTSDRFGRKIIFHVSSVSTAVVATAMAFAPSIVVYFVFKFLVGLCTAFALTGWVWVCEMFPSKSRSNIAINTQMMYPVGWMLLTLFAYFFRTYWHLLLVCYVPVTLSVALIWFVPESIPWLFANNRHEEAIKILRREGGDPAILDSIEKKHMDRKDTVAEKMNKPPKAREISTISDHSSSDGNVTIASASEDAKYNFFDLFKSRVLVVHTLVAGYCQFTNALVYLALSFISVKLAGDKFANFLLSGLVEIPATFLCAFFVTRVGRKWPLVTALICCGVFILPAPFVPEKTDTGVNLVPLIITIVMVAKAAITFSYINTDYFLSELYPTTLRNIGGSLVVFLSRPAELMSPFLVYLERIRPWIPQVVCGILAATAGLLALLLPETKGRPLAATIQDIEEIALIKTKKSHKRNQENENHITHL